ncbi:hypothetical protein [Longispora albida]|uniref:hypothetical protein n=1 Tax=Longispora albida TaxID=203523 RepID=UPI000369260A|nr:hypothetical protein [Longispora albida]
MGDLQGFAGRVRGAVPGDPAAEPVTFPGYAEGVAAQWAAAISARAAEVAKQRELLLRLAEEVEEAAGRYAGADIRPALGGGGDA